MADLWAQQTQAKLYDVVLQMAGGNDYSRGSGSGTGAYGATVFAPGQSGYVQTSNASALFQDAQVWANSHKTSTVTSYEMAGLWDKYKSDPKALFHFANAIDRLATAGNDISKVEAKKFIASKQIKDKPLAPKASAPGSAGSSTGTPTTPIGPTKTTAQIEAEAAAALGAALGTPGNTMGQSLGLNQGISNSLDEARQLVARGMISHFANAPMTAIAPMTTIPKLNLQEQPIG